MYTPIPKVIRKCFVVHENGQAVMVFNDSIAAIHQMDNGCLIILNGWHNITADEDYCTVVNKALDL